MTKPAPGDLWRYPYLWSRQVADGETEGRKDRPAAIIAAIADATGGTHLFLLGLTSQPPRKDQHGIEVPQLEAKRAGLDDDRRIWVMLDDYNYDMAEHSAYLDPDGRLGRFNAAFMKRLLGAYLPLLAAQRSRRIDRRP